MLATKYLNINSFIKVYKVGGNSLKNLLKKSKISLHRFLTIITNSTLFSVFIHKRKNEMKQNPFIYLQRNMLTVSSQPKKYVGSLSLAMTDHKKEPRFRISFNPFFRISALIYKPRQSNFDNELSLQIISPKR